jgi:hypothetical protein
MRKRSRVVPGVPSTSAAVRPASALHSDDLPAFAAPSSSTSPPGAAAGRPASSR